VDGGYVPDVAYGLNAHPSRRYDAQANETFVAETVGALMTSHSPNGHGCAGVNNQAVQSGHVIPVAFGWNKSSSQTLRVDETTDALQASATSNPAVAFNVRGRDGGSQAEIDPDGLANVSDVCARTPATASGFVA